MIQIIVTVLGLVFYKLAKVYSYYKELHTLLLLVKGLFDDVGSPSFTSSSGVCHTCASKGNLCEHFNFDTSKTG